MKDDTNESALTVLSKDRMNRHNYVSNWLEMLCNVLLVPWNRLTMASMELRLYAIGLGFYAICLGCYAMRSGALE